MYVMLVEAWKPFGMTSCDFTMQQKVKLGCSRICHAGRLDPMAQGVMLLLTDDDVSDMSEHLKHKKVYTFNMVIGISTVSNDFASSIISLRDTSHIDNQELETKIVSFIDTYDHQEYPLISSYVINKKPMWWYTQNNIPIPLPAIPSKPVVIFETKVHTISKHTWNDFCKICHDRVAMIKNPKTNEDVKVKEWIDQYEKDAHELNLTYVRMTLEVSSGFYIRKFCDDFGRHIGMPCIALDITREKIINT